MRNTDIERWALQVIDRVDHQQPIEDSRVELKGEWPADLWRAARRIAGHANAARGEPILWLIGVDETIGVRGAVHADFAHWIAPILAYFDQLPPTYFDLNVPTPANQTVVAVVFETDRAPYVVKNHHFGTRNNDPIAFEVPYRRGTDTRTATRAEMLLMLSDAHSLHALLEELAWNIEVTNRNGPHQEQYRITEFERLFGEQLWNTLNEDIQRYLRDAYIAISQAQSLVRSYEAADARSRINLQGEMIAARIEARPLIEVALHSLRELMGRN